VLQYPRDEAVHPVDDLALGTADLVRDLQVGPLIDREALLDHVQDAAVKVVQRIPS
jgi:hypothetical protein